MATKNFKKKKLGFFFNNHRGLKVLKFFIKKKFLISKVILSRKYLNYDLLTILKKDKIKFIVINSLKDKRLLKIYNDLDLGIVCGFPLIFPKKFINKTKYGFINCHAGKLPYYRGGSPLNWQMIYNEDKFGLSVIKINHIIDGGPIIKEKSFKLLKKYTINDLHRIANKNFPSLTYKSVKKIFLNKKLNKQDKAKARTFKQRKQQDSYMNIKKMTFKEVDCLVRALQTPYPNAFLKLSDKIIKVQKVK